MKPISVTHLYPKEMNLYGDTGNRIVLEQRMKWRGIPYRVHLISEGDVIPESTDILLGGGGQDASQGSIEKDFLSKQDSLDRLVDKGTVVLMICGMYQMLGRKFVTSEGVEIEGLDILPLETRAESGRLIGNISVDMDGMVLVGYENHSGRTYLDPGAMPLAKVLRGKGNNDADMTEGCRYKNVFGSYMHGPLLSKNTDFADLLIRLALEKNGSTVGLKPLDDSLEQTARKVAITRPR